jgi:hypothetical protein
VRRVLPARLALTVRAPALGNVDLSRTRVSARCAGRQRQHAYHVARSFGGEGRKEARAGGMGQAAAAAVRLGAQEGRVAESRARRPAARDRPAAAPAAQGGAAVPTLRRRPAPGGGGEPHHLSALPSPRPETHAGLHISRIVRRTRMLHGDGRWSDRATGAAVERTAAGPRRLPPRALRRDLRRSGEAVQFARRLGRSSQGDVLVCAAHQLAGPREGKVKA